MKKLSTLLFSLLCLAALVTAQPTSYVKDMSTDPAWGGQPAGGYVVSTFTPGELFTTTAVVGGIPASYSMIQIWWSGAGWGIKIKDAPFLKFRIKRTTAKTQSFNITYAFTDGSSQGVSHSVSATTSYQDFFFNLQSDITTLELTGKTVKNCYEFQWTLTPSTDDGLYISYFAIGDSANPCTTKRPTIDALPTSTSRNFNATATTDISLTGISDGNSGAKAPITVTATSSDPTIIPNPTVVYNSPDATGTLQIIGTQPPKSGSATISVTITDTAYCNGSIVRTMPVTVKAEALWFVLSSTSMSVNPASGEQTISIDGITNIGKNNVPDNYHGLTLSATAVANGSLLTDYTNAPEIDTTSGSAIFNFTVSPDAADKAQIKINFVLTSATGKVTVPGVTNNPAAVLTITVSKTGLGSAAAAVLHVFPNPASDVINVELPEGADKIDVANAAGVVVKSVNVKGQNGTVQVSTSDLAAGSYVVQAAGASATVIVK